MKLRDVKQSRTKHALFKTQVSLCLLTLVQLAQGNPTGGQVVQGSATITSGQHTVINQTTNSAVINWQDFSIAQGEHTQFVVPDANSATLNRVTGGSTSAILGKLSSNGKVYLINPNGILFGAKAQVNVSSFVASTSNISDQNFMSGHYIFDQPGVDGAKIINYGNISTIADHGLVVLVAPEVINEGIIQANLGKIGIGAGDRWTLDLYGDNLITFSVSEDVQKTLYKVDQKGTLSANGGTVLLTAQAADDILESVINMDGYIEAKTVSETAGNIIVLGNENSRVNIAGMLDASGSLGGNISITGTHLDVASTAHLNASGEFGGGTILMGGGYQGSGLLPHAMTTTIHEYAKIEANALQEGNGGDVVVWSDDHTIFNGDIFAQGGVLGGNGGSVETSSKHILTLGGGSVDTSASLGEAGTWLLDPDFVLIDAVSAASLNAGLLLNATVTVLADIDLLIDTGYTFTWGNDSTLTLAANNNIIFRAGSSIVNTSAGTLNLRADADADGTGTVNFGAGAGVDFSASTGAVNLLYNPTDYTTPTDYSSFVQAGENKFNAYMLVNNLTNLQAIQTNLDGDYALGTDIAAAASFFMNGGLGFDPIGDLDNPFTGSLNFAGYAISNLVINRPDEDLVGLFGATSNAVFNYINILDSSVVGKNLVGIFAGKVYEGSINTSYVRGNVVGNDFVGVSYGSIERVDVNNDTVAVGNVVGHDYVGGVTGAAVNNIIIGNVFHVGDTTGNNIVGGLVGTLTRDATLVGLVFNNGNVTGNSNVGGIAGTVSGIDFDVNGSVGLGGLSGVVSSGEAGGGVIGQLNTNLNSNADALFAEFFGNQGFGGLQKYVGRELSFSNVNTNAAQNAFTSPTYTISLDTNLYRQLGTVDGFGVLRGGESISAKLTSTAATDILRNIVATDLIGGIFENAFDSDGNFKITNMTDSFVSNIASIMSESNKQLSATGVMAMGAGVGGLFLSSRGGLIKSAFGQSMGANLMALFGMVSLSNEADGNSAIANASPTDAVGLQQLAEATSSTWCGVTCRLVMLSVQSPTKLPSFSENMGVNTSTYVKSSIRPNSPQEQRYTWDDSANRYVRTEKLNQSYDISSPVIKITSPL